jgi:hypothetical protein
MASSRSTNDLSQKMEKMSVNGKRHVDAPRYTPPHRKYAQANKTVETSTSAKDASKPTTPTPSVTEKSTVPTSIGSTGSEAVMETKTTSTPTVGATNKDAEAESKPKPSARSMAPHHKYNKPTTKVVDSWEEEEEASTDPSPTNTTPKQPSDTAAPVPKSNYIPPHLKYRSAAPSPPSRSITPPSRSSTPTSSTTPSSSASSERRPEKTNAVAHRLIAGALGVKVPRRTEEQRAYDKAMREQEKKKRDLERGAKKKAEEDAAKAKAAIWDD